MHDEDMRQELLAAKRQMLPTRCKAITQCEGDNFGAFNDTFSPTITQDSWIEKKADTNVI